MEAKSGNRGFTLIELIVTVSIAAVLLAVAVPSFTQFLDESRSHSVVQQFIQSLIAARSEAVGRGALVTLSAINGNWDNGWFSWIDTDGNGDYDDGETIKKSIPVSDGALFTGDRVGTAINNITFSREGFLNDVAEVVISYRTSPEYCSRDRDISISLAGQVRVTERSCS